MGEALTCPAKVLFFINPPFSLLPYLTLVSFPFPDAVKKKKLPAAPDLLQIDNAFKNIEINIFYF